MQLYILHPHQKSPIRGFLIAQIGTRLKWLLWLLLTPLALRAQTDNPYHVNGSAYKRTCNCYILTPDELNKSGSLWNINKIDLRESFDFNFDVYLGTKDQSGADGIAFVLQPISTNIGTVGGGMGYEGVAPSIGVILDTWQNHEDNDPPEDHIAIHKNGIIDHSPLTDVAGPMSASAKSHNIEDGLWHVLRITWNANTKRLSTQFDGYNRVEATIDMVGQIFGGDPLVFWGFTAATGGSSNLQQVCTSLNPAFSFPKDQNTCQSATIRFSDSSTSFGRIDAWYWDFGNGMTSTATNPPPVFYGSPGNYDVKLTILGSNGCLSDTVTQRIVIGSEPMPGFAYSPALVCEGVPVNFIDSSFVEFGTIDRWNWSIAGVGYTDQHPPPLLMEGTSTASLQVGTREGCLSSVSSATVQTYPSPALEFRAGDICLGQPAVFQASSTNPAVPVQRWYWTFGDGNSIVNLSNYQLHHYTAGGLYQATLIGTAANGCPSAPAYQTLTVHETGAFAGHDTVIARNQPLQLTGSGAGEVYNWSPATGLSADNIPNPVATLSDDAEYVLTVSTAAGCSARDTVRIKVYQGPEFYVPSAFTPNGDGRNDRFQFVAVGMTRIDQFRIYNRYGQLIFNIADPRIGWDGTVGGLDQPAGTYVWTISGLDFTGVHHFKKGTVTLIR